MTKFYMKLYRLIAMQKQCYNGSSYLSIDITWELLMSKRSVF